MLARLRRLFRRRPRPPVEECEVCNAPARFVVTDEWTVEEGGTGMAAYYCAAHRPGNGRSLTRKPTLR